MRITALAGGIGAARFLRGLVAATDPQSVTVIGNTGDDANFHGLYISPDLDIVTYTLAGIVDQELGWGIHGDTTHALDQLSNLGVDTWFTLRDRDLGTHMARTTWLADGGTLSEATDRIRKALAVEVKIIPMTNEQVRTKIVTVEGIEREFQEYFVRYSYSEEVSKVFFEGIEAARPAPGVIESIIEADRIMICPSNPVVSIGPILAVEGVREALRQRRDHVTAISPIIEGKAVKGPADRLLPVLGVESSAAGVASLYADFVGSFVIDRRDAPEAERIEELGMRVMVLETIMDTPGLAKELARAILAV